MDPRVNPEQAGALRPLRAASEPLAALRGGELEGAALRRAVLEAADAVEASLRRLLRDAERVELAVRLRALAADEMRPDEVLAELRRHDRISIELAAAVHELLEARRRLAAGSAPEPAAAALALRAADRLEQEALSPPAPPPEAPAPDPVHQETLVHPVPPPAVERSRLAMVAGVVALLLLGAAALFWAIGGREDPRLAQGMTLFRSGAYADAASFFWRYAEDHPDDPTPHLYLARIHRRMGRPELAAQELRTAMDLAPEDADVHAELGFLLLDTDRPEPAVERFRTALRYDAESAEAWIGLVRALQVQGRADAAERVLAQAPERVRDLFARQPPPAL